jgi:uncharacterized membrane protein YciS (DUF1049 family)
MNKSTLIASLLTVFFVLGLVIFRLLWAASQVASLASLGRLPKLPKSWRRWLFDEHNGTSN